MEYIDIFKLSVYIIKDIIVLFSMVLFFKRLLAGSSFKSFFHLFCWIVSFQVLGFLSGYLFPPDEWYQNLSKSYLTPGPKVFPVVWSLLYFLLSIYAWRRQLKKDTPSRVKIAFGIQMFINFTWSMIFFRLNLLWLSLFSIVGMIIFTVYLMIEDINVNKIRWILLVPYLLWLIFAYHLINVIISLQ